MSLHYSAHSSPDLWNPDAGQADEDQGNPRILEDMDQNRFLGHGAGLIPFLQHTDPTRAMMGAKNMKQAVAVVDAQPPLVTTGHEDQVLASGS